MIRQMIKVMARALPVCVLAMNACDSGSLEFEGMLKIKRDACEAKTGSFLAEAQYQCTCNGMPLGNMEICMNQITPMRCDPEAVVKNCQYLHNEVGDTYGSQWRYCRYGFWEYGEVTTDSECKLCDSSFEPICVEQDGIGSVTSCAGGVWENKPCEYGCAPDGKSCNDCEGDVQRCQDDSSLLFCADGVYKTKKCSAGCKNNECASVCSEGEQVCADDGKFRRFCQNDDWETEYCKYGCENGVCIGETWNVDTCDGHVVCDNIPMLNVGGLRCVDNENTNILKNCGLLFVSCKSESECGDCLNGNEKCEKGTHYKCINGEWKDDEKSTLCILKRM